MRVYRRAAKVSPGTLYMPSSRGPRLVRNLAATNRNGGVGAHGWAGRRALRLLLPSVILHVVALLEEWGKAARGKTPPGEDPPWCARNYVPYWSQVLSKAAQRGAAEEILSRVREEGGVREAMRSRGE